MAAPFARALAMMSLVAAAMSAHAGNYGAQQAALGAIGPYKSRGKGGKRPHTKGNGSAKVRRAAVKARNVRRDRRACA